MIRKDSRSIEWIRELRGKYPFTNPQLIEKTIRAFSLLEALAVSGCPFCFKGGTSLMLHLDSRRRLSIDIDIICKPGTDVLGYLRKTSADYGFGEIEAVGRESRTSVPKTHAKCHYEVSYTPTPEAHDTENILLDVLYDEIEYNELVTLPIRSPFLLTEGDPVMVKAPGLMDLLGDKMTAFAPNTTGIPYYKGPKRCSMEIIKQLYDVASIFDVTTNVEIARKAFGRIVPIELGYRGLDDLSVADVTEDILNVSRIICTWGYDDAYQYGELKDGVTRVADFIHSERYNYDSAVIGASKAAYLAALVRSGQNDVGHFDPAVDLREVKLHPSLDKKLSKLRKYRPEAFFYWWKIGELI